GGDRARSRPLIAAALPDEPRGTGPTLGDLGVVSALVVYHEVRLSHVRPDLGPPRREVLPGDFDHLLGRRRRLSAHLESQRLRTGISHCSPRPLSRVLLDAAFLVTPPRARAEYGPHAEGRRHRILHPRAAFA